MGAGNTDFDWAFGLNRLILDAVGVWPSTEKGKRNFKGLRVPLMALSIVVGITLPQTWALRKVISELSLVVDNLTTNSTALAAALKLLCMWNSRKLLYQVVEQAMADYARSRESWECAVMTKQASRARLFTLTCYVIMIASYLGFVGLPLLGVNIRTVNNITDLAERVLPLQSCYPYDLAASPQYELTYVLQLVSGFFVIVSFSSPDNFFGALVFHASGQCEILNHRMMAIMTRDRPEHCKYVEVRMKFLHRMQLRRVVQSHIHLIGFVDAIETSFNMSLLMQVVCLSVIMCCLGYGSINGLAVNGRRPSFLQILTLAGTLLNLMLHMFIYCIASEILAEQSTAVFEAVYSSDWYLRSSNYSRDIIMIMVRSKNPLILTAGKFMNLSLNAYLNILKTSAGYISMLLTVSN